MKSLRPLLPVLFLGLAGCATPKDEQMIPFTPEQIKGAYANARPPQAFGLTVYSTDHGPFFAGAGRVHQGDVVLRPFLSPRESTAPVIGLDARGEEGMPALIDTTAKDSWLTARAARQLDLVMLAGPGPYQTTAQHVYDEIGGAAGLVQKIQMDKLHMENVVFYMHEASGPMGPAARWVDQPAPLAVLGSSFLRSFSYVVLDYPQHACVFGSTGRLPTPAAENLVATMPMKDVMGALAVDGTMDGNPATLLLDTAGDFDLVMNNPTNATLRRISIGDLVFAREINVVSSMDQGLGTTTYPRIGRRLLSRFKISFDFRNKLIYFERPAASKP